MATASQINLADESSTSNLSKVQPSELYSTYDIWNASISAVPPTLVVMVGTHPFEHPRSAWDGELLGHAFSERKAAKMQLPPSSWDFCRCDLQLERTCSSAASACKANQLNWKVRWTWLSAEDM